MRSSFKHTTQVNRWVAPSPQIDGWHHLRTISVAPSPHHLQAFCHVNIPHGLNRFQLHRPMNGRIRQRQPTDSRTYNSRAQLMERQAKILGLGGRP